MIARFGQAPERFAGVQDSDGPEGTRIERRGIKIRELAWSQTTPPEPARPSTDRNWHHALRGEL